MNKRHKRLIWPIIHPYIEMHAIQWKNKLFLKFKMFIIKRITSFKEIIVYTGILWHIYSYFLKSCIKHLYNIANILPDFKHYYFQQLYLDFFLSLSFLCKVNTSKYLFTKYIWKMSAILDRKCPDIFSNIWLIFGSSKSNNFRTTNPIQQISAQTKGCWASLIGNFL